MRVECMSAGCCGAQQGMLTGVPELRSNYMEGGRVPSEQGQMGQGPE